MIRYLDQGIFPDGPADALYVRARCLWELHAPLGLADGWVQADRDSRATGWLCRLQDRLTVACLPCANQDELASFVSFLGVEEVLAPTWVDLPGRIVSYGGMFKPPVETAAQIDRRLWEETTPAGEIHAFLSLCESDSLHLPGRDGFVADVALRRRLRRCHTLAMRQNGELTAVALTTAEAAGSALIGGLAVRPDQRGQGLGRRLLNALTLCLQSDGSRVFLLAADSLRPYYAALGWIPDGEWQIRKKDGVL